MAASIATSTGLDGQAAVHIAAFFLAGRPDDERLFRNRWSDGPIVPVDPPALPQEPLACEAASVRMARSRPAATASSECRAR